jgi:hypothetical protein
VEKPRIGGRLLFKKFHSSFAYPLPHLSSKQTEEHGKEPYPNVIPEDGHGQERLADSEPCFVVKLFCLDWAEGAIENPLECVSYACCNYKGKVDKELVRYQLGALTRECVGLTIREPVLWEIYTAAE